MIKKLFLWWCFDDDFSTEFSGIKNNMPRDCFNAFIGNGGFLVTQDALKNPIGMTLEVYGGL